MNSRLSLSLNAWRSPVVERSRAASEGMMVTERKSEIVAGLPLILSGF